MERNLLHETGSQSETYRAAAVCTGSILVQNSGPCRDQRHWLQMRREMPKEGGFVGQAHTLDAVTILLDFEDYFDHIIDVTLSVNTTGNRKADQVHLRCMSEHQRTDFHGANSAFEIEFGG